MEEMPDLIGTFRRGVWVRAEDFVKVNRKRDEEFIFTHNVIAHFWARKTGEQR